MATSDPSTPLGALSEEEVVSWSGQQLFQACIDYDLVLPLPRPEGGALLEFFLRHLRAARAACVGTAQDGGASPRLPPPPAKTPPPGSEAQGEDPTVPFGSGAFGHPTPDSPPPSRNLASAFDEAAQFARDDPLYRQDVMDSLREAAAMLPVVVPYGGAPGDDQAGYHSSPCSFDEESMGVSSPPRPKPKRTRQERSPQLEHMCRPRTRQIPGCSPAHLRRAGPGTNAGLPSPRGEPSTDRSEPSETEGRRSAGLAAQNQARRVLPPEGASGRDYRDVHLRGTAGNGRSPTEEMAREKRANSADRSTGAAGDGDDATAGDGDVGANDDAAGQASFPLLRTEHWHLLVRLPDRPSDEEIRQLPGPVLAALLRANGICRPDGCTREDAWTAIARWLTTHPAQPLALPLGRLRLAPSPQRGRCSARPRSSQSYDGMIETASESAAAATQSMSDTPPEQDLPSPGKGAARGPLDVCGRKLSSRQAELLRHLPPAPSAADLRPLSIAALRELLRANGVVPRPRTRKKALRATALRLVAIEGAIIRLPAGLSRASDGVAVSPAFPPDAEKTGDDVTRRALGNNQGRTEHDHLSAGADQRAGNPSGAPRCPLHDHGAPGDASTRALELPPMPHRAPAYPADPDTGKLSAAVIAALEGLPPRPSAAQLRATKFAGLQVLMKANGVPRPHNATVESMTRQLGAWLAENDDRELELPHGIQRSGWRPLGDLAAVHRAGRSAGSGRRTRDMSPPPHDGHTGTAPTGPDADLLAHLGAPAHPATAPRRPQASGWVSPSTLRRPYNGSGETGKPGGSTASRGAGRHDEDPLVDDGQIARAAVAFTDSAASTLALLDRLAPLIDRACRGESIPAEALATLGPAVHTARAVLQGAVAGCTAERLRPTLTRASGGNIASATGGPSHAGALQTYTQVASTAPPLPSLPGCAPGAGAYGTPVAGFGGAPSRSNTPARSGVRSTQCCVGSWAWAPDRQWRKSDGPAKVTTRFSSVRRRGSGWKEPCHGPCRDSGCGTGPPPALSGREVRWC